MKIATLFFIALFLTLLSGCYFLRKSVALPNGYTLAIAQNRQPFLIEPSGERILPVSHFMVSGTHVYGWMDNEENLFFFLNTEKKEVFQQLTWEELGKITQQHNIRKFSTREFITFWDITSGSKKKNW